ncbi:helix-turn-helix domain-containing protein [Streptomyces sp. NPDC047315]|uniref:helix-turn-helix domain-containing protein n=1 Tax=Streptomyces sp. NPDC047315 TaxID=3155142 RepID=UPI0033F972F0
MATATGTPAEHGASPVVAVSTDGVAPEERFAWWGEMVGQEVMPVAIDSPHAPTFRGRAMGADLGDGVRLAGFSLSPLVATRQHRHIRRSDPENHYLMLVHGPPIGVAQRRSSVLLRIGEMALFDTSHPLDSEFVDDGRLSRTTLLRLPRASSPFSQDDVDGLLAQRLTPGDGTSAGTGALLAHFMASLRYQPFEPEELRRLGRIGIDLAHAFLAERLDVQRVLPVESRQQVLRVRIVAFIERHLHEPGLTPPVIAAAHHISVRALHLLFRDQPETVAATIRRRRLERTRAELTDPRVRHRTIADVAARWGYRSAADFSRAFRAAYGTTPSEVRRIAVAPRAATDPDAPRSAGSAGAAPPLTPAR